MTDTLFLDIEDVDDRLLLVSYALNDGPIVTAEGVSPDLRNLLSRPDVTLVTQGDHDPLYFVNMGLLVEGPWHNTMVMAWVLDENQSLKLSDLTAKYTPALVKQDTIGTQAGRLFFQKRWPLDDYDNWTDAVKFNFKAYSRKDVETLRALYLALRRRLRDEEWEAYWLTEEVPYSSLLLRMEARGMPVDLGATSTLAEEVRRMRDEHEASLRRVAGLPPCFNFNSPDHLREYLFSAFCSLPDSLPMSMDPLPSDEDFEVTKVGRTLIHGQWLFRGRGLEPTPPPKKKGQETASTKPSTEAKELLFKHGDDPWIQEYVFGFKRNDKLLSTYLDKWPVVAREERLYTHFKQTGTVTGRLSSSDPVNLQNIPKRSEMGKRVRELFVGDFIIGDYDALEMRIMAHYSRDPKLLRVFEEGGDPHALTAHAIFGACDGHDDPRRDVGKLVNYGTQYGGGARTLAMSMTLAGYPTTQSTAKGYIEIVEPFYTRLTSWKRRVIWQSRDLGYVETIGGRLRRIQSYQEAEGWSRGAYGERQAVNSKVQGSAADILRRVMLLVDDYFEGLDLIAQVHDELIWERTTRYSDNITRERLDWLKKACETGHGFDLRVPLVMEPHVCANWGEK
jgi:DNA polymerase-1